MGFFRRYRRPLTVAAAAAAADLLARVVFRFDMSRVVPAEAVVLLSAAICFTLLGRRADAGDPRVRRLDTWLGIFFALGGIRAALWAAGLDVYLANMAVLAIAIVAGAWAWWRRRGR